MVEPLNMCAVLFHWFYFFVTAIRKKYSIGMIAVEGLLILFVLLLCRICFAKIPNEKLANNFLLMVAYCIYIGTRDTSESESVETNYKLSKTD